MGPGQIALLAANTLSRAHRSQSRAMALRWARAGSTQLHGAGVERGGERVDARVEPGGGFFGVVVFAEHVSGV